METAYGKSHQSLAALISPKHASMKEFAGFLVLDLPPAQRAWVHLL
jgi:hypothetical protein